MSPMVMYSLYAAQLLKELSGNQCPAITQQCRYCLTNNPLEFQTAMFVIDFNLGELIIDG